jgi:hypothetical protein
MLLKNLSERLRPLPPPRSCFCWKSCNYGRCVVDTAFTAAAAATSTLLLKWQPLKSSCYEVSVHWSHV